MALKTFLQLYDENNKYIDTVEWEDTDTFYSDLDDKYPNYKTYRLIMV